MRKTLPGISTSHAVNNQFQAGQMPTQSSHSLLTQLFTRDRPGGRRFFKETYFQNMACLNLLGKARPLEQYTALVDLMPEWERNNRRDWIDAITQVSQRHMCAHWL